MLFDCDYDMNHVSEKIIIIIQHKSFPGL